MTILQDAPLIQLINAEHPVFEHPVFLSPEYNSWKELIRSITEPNEGDDKLKKAQINNVLSLFI